MSGLTDTSMVHDGGRAAASGVVLQRLATTAEPARRALYWHGAAEASAPGTPTTALRGAPGAEIDLGTWFNAAPVGWWWSLLGPARCSVSVRGQGVVSLVVAGPSGDPVQVSQGSIGDGWAAVVPDDATWAWLKVTGEGTDGAVVESVEWRWSADAETGDVVLPPLGQRTATVVMPTFRREADCVAQLSRLLGPDLADTVGRVVVIDQGGGTLRTADGFAAIAASAADRLILLEQGNLGGSGGYARGMAESRAWPDDPVLNLDDDAEIDPEVLRRLVRLSVATGAAGRPTVLGTALLSAEEPTSLQALAEAVPRRTFHWGAADQLRAGHDVARTDPSGWGFTQPDDRAEYSGWWGTLLPAGTVARLGLPAPYFIKWDDAEYGLRALRAGLRVATLPGSGVWHPTWAAKGTISSWSAWPLHRNRLATALAYGAGRGAVLDSLVHQVKHVMSLQYGTADLWDAAIGELLDGPAWLFADLTAVRPRAQAVLDGARGGTESDRPRRRVRTLAGPAEFTWRAGIGCSEVRFEDGSPSLVRDAGRAMRALVRTVGLHARLVVRWGGMRQRYRDALKESSTGPQWARRF